MAATAIAATTEWMVPADALRPALLRFVDAHGTKGRDLLAVRSGVDLRKVRLILNGGAERVTFTTADRLVTHGLGEPDLWLTDDDLAAHYPDAEAVL